MRYFSDTNDTGDTSNTAKSSDAIKTSASVTRLSSCLTWKSSLKNSTETFAASKRFSYWFTNTSNQNSRSGYVASHQRHTTFFQSVNSLGVWMLDTGWCGIYLLASQYSQNPIKHSSSSYWHLDANIIIKFWPYYMMFLTRLTIFLPRLCISFWLSVLILLIRWSIYHVSEGQDGGSLWDKVFLLFPLLENIFWVRAQPCEQQARICRYWYITQKHHSRPYNR